MLAAVMPVQINVEAGRIEHAGIIKFQELK